MPKKHVIIVDEKIHSRIKAAVHYAFEHPYSLNEMFRLKGQQMAGLCPAPPPVLRVIIPPSTSTIFTVELDNAGPGTWSRHLSIGLRGPQFTQEDGPDPRLVEFLLNEFEFECTKLDFADPAKSPISVHVNKRARAFSFYETVTKFPDYAAR